VVALPAIILRGTGSKEEREKREERGEERGERREGRGERREEREGEERATLVPNTDSKLRVHGRGNE